MLCLCLQCVTSWWSPYITQSSETWKYEYREVFTTCLYHFKITMVFMNQITRRRPSKLDIIHRIINMVYKCYKYYLKVMKIFSWSGYYIVEWLSTCTYVIYIYCRMKILPYQYLKFINKIQELKNVRVFLKEQNKQPEHEKKMVHLQNTALILVQIPNLFKDTLLSN